MNINFISSFIAFIFYFFFYIITRNVLVDNYAGLPKHDYEITAFMNFMFVITIIMIIVSVVCYIYRKIELKRK